LNPPKFLKSEENKTKVEFPYIALAPMEGLMDFHLREILTNIGGIDHCVTEFIRVSQTLLPKRVFFKYCPELSNQGRTTSGTPVHIQLLGSDPDLMAENARKAANYGAPAIDLNFGCPAKTVNKSQGGAVLLKDPEVLYRIARAVRSAVPTETPVSAKMRLGYNDKSLALENAEALEEAGIQWLTVHARTKTEGYRPPAYWDWIAQIRRRVAVPVIANGEIWTPGDAHQCQKQSTSPILMIGRGLVARPDLASQIKAAASNRPIQPLSWQNRVSLLFKLAAPLDHLNDKQLTDRMKQWLHYLSIDCPHTRTLFDQVKRAKTRTDFFRPIRAACEIDTATNGLEAL
jgi:tRNA-dihydrouridine synthase C